MNVPDCVGLLYRWDPQTKEISNPCAISPFRPLLVGRNRRTWYSLHLLAQSNNMVTNATEWCTSSQYVLNDAYVSNQHLRIYAIICEVENSLLVSALVYAQDLSTNGTFWNGQRIRKSNGGAVLLSHGDIIRLSSTTFLEFRTDYQTERPLTLTQTKEVKEFDHEYLITDRLLGEGGFGQVRMAISLSTASQVACKVVDLRAIEASRTIIPGTNMPEQLKREVLILQNLRHPNIIGIERTFQSDNSLYIFQDLATGGDLYTYIDSLTEQIPDLEAAFIIMQILIAVDYLHDHGIAHRDLKPENILMNMHGTQRRIVVADFGCATTIPIGSKRMSTKIGTLEYTAPEVYHESNLGGYTQAVDLWSVGCIAVVVLIGMPPFPSYVSGFIDQVEPGDLKRVFTSEKWNTSSAAAQSFVLSLLVLDKRKRLTAKEALLHSWFGNTQYRAQLKQRYAEVIADWRPLSSTSFPDVKSASKKVKAASIPNLRSDKTENWKFTYRLGKVVKSGAFRDEAFNCEPPKLTVINNDNESFTRYQQQCFRLATEVQQMEPLQMRRNVSIEERQVFDTDRSFSIKPGFSGIRHDGFESITSRNTSQKSYSKSGPSPSTLNWVAGLKRSREEINSQSSEPGEVYEEIVNRVTGKVQRILYEEK